MVSYLQRTTPIAALLMLSLLGWPAMAQNGGLPGGANTLNESHGDWAVSCAVVNQNGAPGKVCVLSQQQTTGQSGQRVLAVELRPQDTTVDGTLVLPFGIALDKGVTLQVDDGPALAPLRFRTCLPGGCVVDLSFDAKMLPLLRKGSSLKIRTIADGGKETQLAVSLKGFPSALDRTIALSK
ncbi:invasion associated locus B family protein [Chelatococcus sp. GCM10030263]|uniref:invasion associated locus B family protein n=1 Tax=Chelatococcus sp. GCM10030263 TaxID=3273387 RepID=UPI003615F1E4